MLRTQKKEQYALRALLELAKHLGEGPLKISEIAKIQAIPVRFLEVILNQLKGSGLIESKRGYYGGYTLVRPADQISVGDVLRFMHGDDDWVHKISCNSKKECPFKCDCAFVPMWKEVNDAMFKIYDSTTLQDLIENEKKIRHKSQAKRGYQ